MSTSHAILYEAVNTSNGKTYVGVTSQGLKRRRTKHLWDAANQKGGCRYFCAAIRRYGPDAFDFRTLAVLPCLRDAQELEIAFIAKWKPEYNLSGGGQGTLGLGRPGPLNAFSGKRHSPAARAKMRAERAGRKLSAAHRIALVSSAGTTLRKPVICLVTGNRWPSATEASRELGWADTAVSNAIGKMRGTYRGHVFAYEQAR